MRNETVSQTKTKVNKRTMSKLNKNKRIIGYILCIYFALGLGSHLVLASPAPIGSTSAIQLAPLVQLEIKHTVNKPAAIAFKHGDISWLPQLATQAGWPKKTWKKLGQIILRESGGCPNRIGSSIVDKNCNITIQDCCKLMELTGILNETVHNCFVQNIKSAHKNNCWIQSPI
jgi:hypothetical protein